MVLFQSLEKFRKKIEAKMIDNLILQRLGQVLTLWKASFLQFFTHI